jgi:hypothetical protein
MYLFIFSDNDIASTMSAVRRRATTKLNGETSLQRILRRKNLQNTITRLCLQKTGA